MPVACSRNITGPPVAALKTFQTMEMESMCLIQDIYEANAGGSITSWETKDFSGARMARNMRLDVLRLIPCVIHLQKSEEGT